VTDRVAPRSDRCARAPSKSLVQSATRADESSLVVPAQWMGDRLISIREIRELFGLGRTAAYELTHRTSFPEPVVVSPRCYRWWASEVTAFAASIRGQPAKPKRPASCERPRREPDLSTSACRITGKVRAARTRRPAP
jgi:predicted DNA-binding transcriptional regulator AlpA